MEIVHLHHSIRNTLPFHPRVSSDPLITLLFLNLLAVVVLGLICQVVIAATIKKPTLVSGPLDSLHLF